MRQGCIVRGAHSAFRMVWTNNYTGEETPHADFTCQMTDPHEGTLRIQMDDMEQTIFLTPRPRKFGGHQWYFVCPAMNRCCSVLWMPPGPCVGRPTALNFIFAPNSFTADWFRFSADVDGGAGVSGGSFGELGARFDVTMSSGENFSVSFVKVGDNRSEATIVVRSN
jgi:hypothetical protein